MGRQLVHECGVQTTPSPASRKWGFLCHALAGLCVHPKAYLLCETKNISSSSAGEIFFFQLPVVALVDTAWVTFKVLCALKKHVCPWVCERWQSLSGEIMGSPGSRWEFLRELKVAMNSLAFPEETYRGAPCCALQFST